MNRKFTINSFAKAKQEKTAITMLTAYDYSMAQLADKAGIDTILVGDSLGMVVQGHENTLSVTVDDIIYHTRAVKRGVKRAFIIADMPFMSYHVSAEQAVENAGRIIKESGAGAIKLEGGANVLDKVKAIVSAQIPVVAHIGLTPQSINVFGGFKVQGKQLEQAKQLIEDAHKLERAGAFALTLEGIPEQLARIITAELSIPTIGIGAGKYCDGQVLVINDLLGMYCNFIPKFVKQYALLQNDIDLAIKQYIEEVRKGDFPTKNHTYTMEKSVFEQLEKKLK